MAQPIVVPLWEGRPPHALADADPGSRPLLEIFSPDGDATGAGMLIYPGGSYTFLSDKSGVAYARWLVASGVTAIVVHFRLGSDGYRYPAILGDAWQALRLARERAESWDIDPERIGVIGTSAGGHLAALMVTGTATDPARKVPLERPALGVLCYPVVSLVDPFAHAETRANFLGADEHDRGLQERFSADLAVTSDAAPTFVWHTLADPEVAADNSRRFAAALHSCGVPYELHLYERGAHALGLAREEGLGWSQDCIRWLRDRGFAAA